MCLFCWVMYPAAALHAQTIPEYNRSIGIEKLERYLDLKKPEGEGPFPAVILAAECFGFRSAYTVQHYDDVQQKLVDEGYVVVKAQINRARWEYACDDGGYTRNAGARDIRIIAEYLREQDFVLPKRIAAWGWEFGGNLALLSGSLEITAPLHAVIAYYPTCRSLWEWQPLVPMLVIAGDSDNYAPLTKCQEVFNEHPEFVYVQILRNSHFFFDVEILMQQPVLYYRGHVAHNPRSTETAWKEVLHFLRASPDAGHIE